MRELINFLQPLDFANGAAADEQQFRRHYRALSGDEKTLLSRHVAPEVLRRLQSKKMPLNDDLISLRNGLNNAQNAHVSAREGDDLLMQKLLMAAGGSDNNLAFNIIQAANTNDPYFQAKQGLLKYVEAIKRELGVQDEAALTALLRSTNDANQKRVARVLGKYAFKLALQAAASVKGTVLDNTVKRQDEDSKKLLAAQAEKGMFLYPDATPNSEYMKWQKQLQLACESANLGFFTSLFYSDAKVNPRNYFTPKWLISRVLNRIIYELDFRGLFSTRDIGIATFLAIALYPPLVPFLAGFFVFSLAVEAASIVGTAIKEGVSFIGSVALGAYSMSESGVNVLLGLIDFSYRAIRSLPYIPLFLADVARVIFETPANLLHTVNNFLRQTCQNIPYLNRAINAICFVSEIPVSVLSAVASVFQWMTPRDLHTQFYNLWNRQILSIPSEPDSQYSIIKNLSYNSLITAIYEAIGFDMDPSVQKARANISLDNAEKRTERIALHSLRIDHPQAPGVQLEPALAPDKSWTQKMKDNTGLGEGRNNQNY